MIEFLIHKFEEQLNHHKEAVLAGHVTNHEHYRVVIAKIELLEYVIDEIRNAANEDYDD